jgi:hypothetical protein
VCEKKKKKAMGCQGILPGMNAVLLAVSTRCLITKYLNNESLSKAQRRATGIPLSIERDEGQQLVVLPRSGFVGPSSSATCATDLNSFVMNTLSSAAGEAPYTTAGHWQCCQSFFPDVIESGYNPSAVILQHLKWRQWGARLESAVRQALDLKCRPLARDVENLIGMGEVAGGEEVRPSRENGATCWHPCTHMVEKSAADCENNGLMSVLKRSMRPLALAVFFGGAGYFTRALLSSLPPDFLDRWRKLLRDQPVHESKPFVEPQPETVIYDCHGVVIATVVAGGYSGKCDPVKTKGLGQAAAEPSDIPSAMWQAVVAAEDRHFFEHHGVDPSGLTRAILSLATSGGGSTITQQLVKNVFLTNDRTWTRKFMEIILSLVLEKQLSKWDILHLYLKKVFCGSISGCAIHSRLQFN